MSTHASARRSDWKIVAWALGAGFGLLVLVGVLTSLPDEQEPEPPSPSAIAGLVRAESERAYLDQLGAIDSRLVSDEDAALQKAEELCADVGQDWAQARVVRSLWGEDPSHANADRMLQALQAESLMQRYIC